MKLINTCVALVAVFVAYACAAAVPNGRMTGECDINTCPIEQ